MGIFRTYRFLLVGGSGFLGKQLAQRLIRCGHHVVVSTRRPADCWIFPEGVRVVGQDDVTAELALADAVVVLSVVNNDVIASPEEVMAINVDYPVSLARRMAMQGRGLFVAFGSAHAQDDRRQDAYSISKRALRRNLADVRGIAVRFLVLPPVHGRAFVRKLKWVDRLPRRLRAWAVTLIGAIKPLVHVDMVADQLMKDVAVHHGADHHGNASFEIRWLADDQSSNAVYRTTVRIMDLVLAGCVLIGFGWLMLALAAFIRSGSPGPALFCQRRIGRHEHLFTCYKFRTMVVDTPQVATHEVSHAHTTSLGASLRRWKLDELPQIFNVFANDMSWVGPRPCLPTQTALIDARRKAGVTELKAGITGLAQLRGIDMSNPVRLVEAEREWAASRSIPQYFSIMTKTFLGKGSGDKIVR